MKKENYNNPEHLVSLLELLLITLVSAFPKQIFIQPCSKQYIIVNGLETSPVLCRVYLYYADHRHLVDI